MGYERFKKVGLGFGGNQQIINSCQEWLGRVIWFWGMRTFFVFDLFLLGGDWLNKERKIWKLREKGSNLERRRGSRIMQLDFVVIKK